MPKQSSLGTFFKPTPPTPFSTNPPKRKRSSKNDDDEEEAPQPEPSKKQKTTSQTTASKSKKPAPIPKKSKPSPVNKAALQNYKTTIQKVTDRLKVLDKKVKTQNPNNPSTTSEDYAETVIKFLPDVEKLSNMGEDGVGWAFNLLLFLGEHSYGDIDDSFKMCGFGGHVGPYRAMDEAMMRLIERRVLKGDIGMKIDNGEKRDVVEVRHQWTDADADVGVFKTGRPNKQQRGQIASQKMQWMKERSQEMRDRREKERDWVGNAIVELVEQRDFIAGYGHDGFFVRSIARLEELRDSSSAVETAA